MALEEVLAQVGNSGRFQVMFCGIITTMETVIAWSMMQTAILGATPKWWCVDPSSLDPVDNTHTLTPTLTNLTYHTCSPSLSFPPSGSHGQNFSRETTSSSESTASCVRYYDPGMVTIISEWDLVCERKYIKAVVNSVQMAGVLVGAVISGQSSDTFGRRVTCYVTMLVHAVTCLVAGFSSSWQVYAACRFFVGASIGSFLVLHYVYMIEFVSHTWRPYLASIPTWPVGAGLMCLTAWRVPHWRYLHFIAAALSVPPLLGWFVSPESVRWLAAKGRIGAAEQVVDRIAQVNRRTKAPDTSEQLGLLAEEEKTHGDSDQKYAYHTLSRDWRSTFRILVLAFAWMSLSLSFYGIILGVSTLSGNVFLNMFVLSVVNVPFNIITSTVMLRVTRRRVACVFFFLGSLTAFGILVADRAAYEEVKGTAVRAIAICSKLFIASTWITMQVFTAELYPTVIRTLAQGAVYTGARIGGILAPFVLDMSTADDTIRSYVIVGSVMAVSGLLILSLGETKGKALTDTLHQQQEDLNPNL